MSESITDSQKLEIRQTNERVQFERDQERAQLKLRVGTGRNEAKRTLAMVRAIDTYLKGAELSDDELPALHGQITLLREKCTNAASTTWLRRL